MPKVRSGHPSDDALERYSLGQSTEAECAPLEDHLLVCNDCQERLTQIDSEIADIKQVCRDVATEPDPVRKPGFFARFAFPAPVWAAAAAALVLAVAVPVYWQSAAPRAQSDVVLEASRGAAPIARAKAGDDLRLDIDLTQFTAPGPYRVDIVASDGERVWSAEAVAASGHASLAAPSTLKAGNYWVRIYAADGALAREYGLQLK